MPLKILSVVGARPNFMKIAAVCDAVSGKTRYAADVEISDALWAKVLPKPDLVTVR